jgi:beta-galactosidase beta subunit
MDPTTKTVDKNYAFWHENYLDVKNLVKQRELLTEVVPDDQQQVAKNLIKMRKAKIKKVEPNVYRL